MDLAGAYRQSVRYAWERAMTVLYWLLGWFLVAPVGALLVARFATQAHATTSAPWAQPAPAAAEPASRGPRLPSPRSPLALPERHSAAR